MRNLPQLSKSFPTEKEFIEAYSGKASPRYIEVNKKLEGKRLQINGNRHTLKYGDMLIAFPWDREAFRIPGLGFLHSSQL